MLDRANSGPEPSAEILRAIRHGVAAGAWRVAGRASGQADCFSRADSHSVKARANLHQAARSRLAERAIAEGVGVCPSISESARSARDSRSMPMSLSPDAS